MNVETPSTGAARAIDSRMISVLTFPDFGIVGTPWPLISFGPEPPYLTGVTYINDQALIRCTNGSARV